MNILKKYTIPFVIGGVCNYYYFTGLNEFTSNVDKLSIGFLIVGFDLLLSFMMVKDLMKK